MTRTTRTDWLDAGLRLLAVHGARQLTIHALCQTLDRTKGSFYHHFDGFADFKTDLLQHFERHGTRQIIETIEEEPTPAAKLRRLLTIVVERSRQVDDTPAVAIRTWALHDEEVRTVQQRVDARRLDYLQSLCCELCSDVPEARRMARSLYAVLVGGQQIYPPINGNDLRAIFDELLDLYDIPDPHA